MPRPSPWALSRAHFNGSQGDELAGVRPLGLRGALILRAPSHLGNTGSDAGHVLTATTGAFVAGAGTYTTTVLPLLALAGVSSTAPIVGWLVAGGLAAAAGSIALVGAIKGAKLNKDTWIQAAIDAGIPNATEIPSFTAKVMSSDADKQDELLQKYGAKADKDTAKGKTGTNDQVKASVAAAVVLARKVTERAPNAKIIEAQTRVNAAHYDDGRVTLPQIEADAAAPVDPGAGLSDYAMYAAAAAGIVAVCAVVALAFKARR
jgi:hypothetical protein